MSVSNFEKLFVEEMRKALDNEIINGPPYKVAKVRSLPPPGAFCSHATMQECHPGCGHFSCTCGIEWDEGSEGGTS